MKTKKFYIIMCIMLGILGIFSVFGAFLLLACSLSNFYSVFFLILTIDYFVSFLFCGYCGGVYDGLDEKNKK